MTENDDHRLVSREDDDGTYQAAVVRRTPETDQLTDDEIITSLEQWRAKRDHPAGAPHERWPMPATFSDWLTATKPGPSEPCPECGCWGLRRGASPDNPDVEKVVCTNLECEASPFYRA
ncbi:hypothetical protein ACWET9_22625 [Streptomyces sp. NPDC004059]